MEPIEQKLIELSAELRTYAAKQADEQKVTGGVLAETKEAFAKILAQYKEQQVQLDAIDSKVQAFETRANPGGQQKSIGELFTGHADFIARKSQMEMSLSGKPLAIDLHAGLPQRDTKTTISAIGSQTTGIQPLARIQIAPVEMAMQALRIRDLMRVRQLTTGTAFDFVRQTTRTNAASPQTEAAAKAESTYGWTAYSDTVRTIPHYTNVSRQALDDIPWMRRTLDEELMYGLKLKEEDEILSGDGTGVHLNGLITQATAYSQTILAAAAGWTRLDVLRDAILQVRLAGLGTFAASGIVLHPTDMAYLETTKDSYGRYMIGDPRGGPGVTLTWGLPVVESDSITQGTFLVGAFATAAELIDRMAMTVAISFEHDTNFTKNIATILCEERIGLAVLRPTAFVTGSFSTSPQ